MSRSASVTEEAGYAWGTFNYSERGRRVKGLATGEKEASVWAKDRTSCVVIGAVVVLLCHISASSITVDD